MDWNSRLEMAWELIGVSALLSALLIAAAVLLAGRDDETQAPMLSSRPEQQT
jgi:hypothetical protein